MKSIAPDNRRSVPRSRLFARNLRLWSLAALSTLLHATPTFARRARRQLMSLCEDSRSIHHFLRPKLASLARLLLPPGRCFHLRVFKRNLVYSLLDRRLSVPGQFTVMVFVLYGVPLLLNTLNDTTVALPRNSDSLGHSGAAEPPSVPFLADWPTAILLAFLFPIHTVVVTRLWRTIEKTFDQLHKDGVVRQNRRTRAEIIVRFSQWYSSRALNLLGLIGSILFTIWFMKAGRNDLPWWGGSHGGILGQAAFAWASTIIWYQLVLHNLKGVVSIALTWKVLGTAPVRPILFHEDDRQGLRGVSDCCFLSFLTTVVHSITLLLLVYGGYLTSVTGTLFIVLLSIIVVFCPLFLGLPMILISRALKKSQCDALRNLRFVARNFTENSFLQEASDPADTTSDLRGLRDVALLRAELRRQPTRLLSTTRLLLGGFGYAAQIAAALITLAEVNPLR